VSPNDNSPSAIATASIVTGDNHSSAFNGPAIIGVSITAGFAALFIFITLYGFISLRGNFEVLRTMKMWRFLSVLELLPRSGL
jgi:hypothetical protein